ncbi:MAG: FkbM family methyltransferase [Bacteroidota bacterium]
MEDKLIKLIKHICKFGLLRGLNIYIKNKVLTKRESVISLNGYPYPMFLRSSTSDIPTFNQIFVNLEYGYPLKLEPDFIIDCGANVGLASLFFRNKYPNAAISAIEPEESNYLMLLKNTQNYPKINCIKAGIWNKSVILDVKDENNFGNYGFICKEVERESPSTIKAVTIREVMERNNRTEIDILKIDIEGAELELFSSDYEYWLPRTKVIMVELHDWFRKGCSKSFFTAIIKYNFSIFHNGELVICVRNDP